MTPPPTTTEMTRSADGPTPSLATDFAELKVGLDPLDWLALQTTPEVVLGDSVKTLLAQINSLAAAGTRRGAAQRLAAREVVLARVSLRFREAIANVELEKLGRGCGDVKRVAMLERLVEGGIRRLMACLDRLARLDAVPVPQLRVSATNAQINLAGGAR